MFILCFLSKNQYAPSDTTLSNALPMPNNIKGNNKLDTANMLLEYILNNSFERKKSLNIKNIMKKLKNKLRSFIFHLPFANEYCFFKLTSSKYILH